MKYHQVSVFTGYAENSIQSVDTIQGDLDLQEAAELAQRHIQSIVFDDDDSEDTKAYVEEFFTGIIIVDGIAYVAEGEENVTLVIPETSVWFDRVLNNEESVYTEHADAWSALIDGQWCA